MPPSGKRISMKDFHFFRFEAGKIVEHWNQVGFA
jgi:predicted ester cyclase